MGSQDRKVLQADSDDSDQPARMRRLICHRCTHLSEDTLFLRCGSVISDFEVMLKQIPDGRSCLK